MGFLRHRRSIKSTTLSCSGFPEGEIASNPALAHRLDESRLVIPWQVAPQQSLPPLHQLLKLCKIEAVDSNEPAKSKTFRLDFYVRQRITVRLDFYMRQWAGCARSGWKSLSIHYPLMKSQFNLAA
jgi:hypothetical protein